jgi:hypothetical protein
MLPDNALMQLLFEVQPLLVSPSSNFDTGTPVQRQTTSAMSSSSTSSVKEMEHVMAARATGVPPDVPSWRGMLTAAAQGHVTRAP